MAERDPGVQTHALSRRAFLVASGAASCSVLFGCAPGAGGATPPDAKLAANSWVTLFSDGAIEIVCPGIELGQGASTTLPRFLAEELDADWDRVKVIAAPADEKAYGNPLFWGTQITAGSRTCLGYFDVLRIAGAQARFVLMSAAARKWGVPIDELATERSVVSHVRSGRRLDYGELVGIATVPSRFPEFVAMDEIAQVRDDFFGDPPPSQLVDGPGKAGAIRLKTRDQYRLIGVDSPRRDIAPKTKGAARYGIDVRLPDMVYATVVTGAVLDEVPRSVDDAAARAVPGVLDIVQLPYGVAVVGTNTASVLRGLERLSVEWGRGPRSGMFDSDRVLDEFAEMANGGAPAAVKAFERGGAEAIDDAFAGSKKISFEMRSELVYHAPIEPQNATVRIAPDGRSAEVWVGTQWPRLEQEAVARVLGIEADAVQLHMVPPGGSFGRRQEPGAVIDAAHVARAVGRPVKVLWSRQEDIKRNPFRQAMVCRAEAAIGPDGRIEALRHRVVADSWFARMFPHFFDQYNKTDPGNWTGALCAYDVPLQSVEAITPRRDIDICYMRGIGVAQVKFAQETLVDLVAIEQERDPLDYRKAMLRREPRALAVLDAVAAASNWRQARARASADRALGIAYTPYSNAHSALVADVSLDRKTGIVRVNEVWCAVDVGLAAQPDIVASQIEGGILQGLSIALHERITVRNGSIQETGFADYPILRMSSAPRVNVRVMSTRNPIAGAGEIGTMQIAPAINSALMRMGLRPLTSLPMLPERVLQAVRA